MINEFLRAFKKLPKQPNRKNRFDKFTEKRIDSFHACENTQKTLQQQELEALTRIVDNQIELEFKLHEKSFMKTFLPSPNTYHLLDQVGQDALNKKRSPFSVLISYITGKEKLRNV
jgi:hypothetical protein